MHATEEAVLESMVQGIKLYKLPKRH